jgi:hypothetical protein
MWRIRVATIANNAVAKSQPAEWHSFWCSR